MVFDATKKLMFFDQTGKFPITSARGNKYIMVAVELDGNYIDGERLQSRSAKSLTKAYKPFFSVGRRLESSARTGTYSITKHQRS